MASVSEGLSLQENNPVANNIAKNTYPEIFIFVFLNKQDFIFEKAFILFLSRQYPITFPYKRKPDRAGIDFRSNLNKNSFPVEGDKHDDPDNDEKHGKNQRTIEISGKG